MNLAFRIAKTCFHTTPGELFDERKTIVNSHNTSPPSIELVSETSPSCVSIPSTITLVWSLIVAITSRITDLKVTVQSDPLKLR